MTATMTASPEASGVAGLSRDQYDEVFASEFAEFYFCIHMPGSDRKVAGIEPTFKGETLDPNMVNSVQARLIPKELSKPSEQANRQLRVLVHAHCLPGSGKSYYYVNARKAGDFIAAFDTRLAEFEAAADSIASAHAEIMARNHDYWRPRVSSDAEYESLIGGLLPATPEALRARYAVEYRLVAEKDIKVAARAMRYRTDHVRDWFNAAFTQAVENAHAERRARYCEPKARLRAAMAGFRLQLTQGDKLSPKSFNAFEDAMLLLRTCADITAPEELAEIEELAAELAAVKATALDTMTNRGGTFTGAVKARKQTLTDLIDRVAETCRVATSEAALVDRFGRAPRGLRLDALADA